MAMTGAEMAELQARAAERASKARDRIGLLMLAAEQEAAGSAQTIDILVACILANVYTLRAAGAFGVIKQVSDVTLDAVERVSFLIERAKNVAEMEKL